ncbi:MAG: hypothetical protein IJP70_01650 [Bacteroidales bacterium]|nr:hypothetical protein [Bacteroidales bacterium]
MSEKYYGIGTMTVTITDKVTGTAEVTQVFDVPSFDSFTDYEFPFFTDLTTGIKDIQLVFNGTGNDWGYICNYKDIFFESYEIASHYNALPMYGTSVLDTNSGSINTSSGAPRAETQSGTIYTQIGFVNKDTYADDYYVYISGNETAYYDLRTNISYYNNGGTFKLTITDVTTHTKEVDAQESATITAKGNIVLPITNALTPGLKKIRFDFVNDDATTYLFNLKDICFYKRSLNESYDYTPAAASNVDVVLTRSITANNWSTICLPFALTSEQLTSTFGSGVKVAELSESGTDENTLSFSSVTSTTANKPYAIKVASDFTSATISGVTIEEGTPTQSVGDWEFIGTYSTVSNLAEGNFYIKSNSLYQATGTQSVKPFRGYFHYKGSGSPRQVSFFVDSETSVESVQAAETTDKASAFDLQGRRVNESHLTRGMYIVNGKKMIVR